MTKAALVCLLLAACGGSKTPLAVDYGDGTGSLVGKTIILNGVALGAISDFPDAVGGTRFAESGSTELSAAGATSDQTFVVAYLDPDTTQQGVFYGRSDAPALPTTSGATLTGDYAGYVYSARDGGYTRQITGDVLAELDFGTSTIDLTISGRQCLCAGVTPGNIVFTGLTWDESARFAGAGTAGTTDFSDGGFASTATPQVQGLIGNDGTEVVGAVEYTQTTFDGAVLITYREVGGFIAD